MCGGCDEDVQDDDTTADDDVADDDVTTDDDVADDDSADIVRWTGMAEVRVVDPDGNPVEGVFAMLGGALEDEWAITDADGRATVEVWDDGITDRWVLTGAEGYKTGGADIDDETGPDGVLEMVIVPLPPTDEDNADYHFQPGGTSHSMDTTDCGHCHPTKADDWNTSPHHDSASNSRTWDLYVGGSELDAADCEALGGWTAEGQEPGVAGGVVERCYLGDGVLAMLHEGCGAEGEPSCDHPDQASTLESFGSCGDCHSPMVDAIPGGEIDFARTTDFAYSEGISCDLCHKIRSVEAGGAPGRDGAIQLQRPSEPTTVFSQDFDPVNFGPYPDVVVAIMKGAYEPGMRHDAGWCSGCHEYARGSLHPDHVVDAARWPAGLPIGETWSEHQASGFAGTAATCQLCHMGVLEEQSSTYNITDRGLIPSPDQGWVRETGEVRRHHFIYDRGAPAYDLQLSLQRVGTDVEASVTVTNLSAGHALPTGEPMRQLLVRVDAVDEDGEDVAANGGWAVPDVGGRLVQGVFGDDVTAAGEELVFPGMTLPTAIVVRMARPTGTWDDYAGPGTASFDGSTAEEKGLPILEVIGERAILSIAGDTVTVDGGLPDLRPGDVIYLGGANDDAGSAGWLYGKVLVDRDGNRGVAHYRAVDMASDNRLGPGVAATSVHRFPTLAPGDPLEVTVRLVLRNYAAPVAHRYGWDVTDEEVMVATGTHTLIDQ